MTLPGVRILDLTRNLPGPFATGLLCGMGAEVLKIEDPDRPDLVKSFPPLDAEGGSLTYEALNRGKRRLGVRLRTPQGVAVIQRLLGHYDILVESWRPGVLQRSGLDATSLLAQHPALIYCSLTGYGQDGPLAQRAGHDINYLARSGLASVTGTADGTLTLPGFQLADIAAGGLMAALAILGAVTERHASGCGRHLDVSMAGSALEFMPLQSAQAVLNHNSPAPGRAMLSGGLPQYRYYRCADGRFVSVGALEPKFWTRLCETLELGPLPYPDLLDGDPDNLAARLAARFVERSRDAWTAVFASIDCCVEPVLELHEALTSEFARHRGIPQKLLEKTPPCPCALEEAGFTADEIADLETAGILGTRRGDGQPRTG